MRNEGRQFQRAYVFREVERIGMVGSMGCNGISIVIDTGNNLGALITVKGCLFNTCTGAASPTEQVYI